MGQRIDNLVIEGFKSIRKLELDLDSINILIGANGSGKTNFVSFFRLLADMVERRLQYVVGKNGGPEAFLHFGSKVTDKIVGKISFGKNTYEFELEPTTDNRLIYADETLTLDDPYPGSGVTISEIGRGHDESKLNQEYKGIYMNFAGDFYPAISSWVVYHFHDTSDTAKLKKRGGINDNERLRNDASNLAAFLFRLQESDETSYRNIRDTVRLIAPFFDDFKLRPIPNDPEGIQLEWKQKNSDYPFLASQLSDGTLRFICLATTLLQPNPPSTILLDEPELGLHPYAITVLAELLRSAAINTQIIAATQSVTLVNQFKPRDIIVIEQKDEQSLFRRLDEDDMKDWIEDYGLGDLWEKNIIGGRP